MTCRCSRAAGTTNHFLMGFVSSVFCICAMNSCLRFCVLSRSYCVLFVAVLFPRWVYSSTLFSFVVVSGIFLLSIVSLIIRFCSSSIAASTFVSPKLNLCSVAAACWASAEVLTPATSNLCSLTRSDIRRFDWTTYERLQWLQRTSYTHSSSRRSLSFGVLSNEPTVWYHLEVVVILFSHNPGYPVRGPSNVK